MTSGRSGSRSQTRGGGLEIINGGGRMKAGSLFTGIGGFDLALEMGGVEVIWQSEIERHCLELLKEKWPSVKRYRDIRKFLEWDAEPVDIIVGGDPCPCRSRLRTNKKSLHPDLSGYFLAVVGRLRPKWMVRENVFASDVSYFTTALEAVGYGTIVIKTNAAGFTGQSRPRDFIVGCYQASRLRIAKLFLEYEKYYGSGKAYINSQLRKESVECLSTQRNSCGTSMCRIWEPTGGLRILDSEEREALAGFPAGWTSGFPDGIRTRMLGNSVVPIVAYECVLRRIIEDESTPRT